MKRFVQFLLVAAGGGAIALHAADPAKIDGYERVGFDRLASYTFTPPDADPAKPEAPPPSGANQIPARIKALDQQKVAVTGFILPVKMDGGLVKEFFLVKDPMLCCYGVMPKINEWVVVRMVGSGVKPLMDIPITFEGKLHVGEMYDNGYLRFVSPRRRPPDRNKGLSSRAGGTRQGGKNQVTRIKAGRRPIFVIS